MGVAVVDGRLGTVAGEMCKEERAESGQLLPPSGLSWSCVVVGVAQGCCLPRGPSQLGLGTGAAPLRPLCGDRQWWHAYLRATLWRSLMLPGLAGLLWFALWTELWTVWLCRGRILWAVLWLGSRWVLWLLAFEWPWWPAPMWPVW